MTKVDSKTFWTGAFDGDEARGLTVRVGPFRCAPVNENRGAAEWAVMRDGAEYPHGHLFGSRQDAVDWMVDDCLARHGGGVTLSN